MAIAIGVGVTELVILATEALAAAIAATATVYTAKEVAEAISKSDKTIDVVPPVAECPKRCPPCPACPPIPPRTDVVPPSRPHWPCPGTHTHVYVNESNQALYPNCKCFCNKKEIEVICH